MNIELNNDQTKEIMIQIFNLQLNIGPLLDPGYLKPRFAFLCNSDGYNKGDGLDLPEEGITIHPINKRYTEQITINQKKRTENIFWYHYMDIKKKPTGNYTSWDRQEPYRLTLPYGIKSIEIAPDILSGVMLNTHSEAFLFPCGFSIILTLRIKGQVRFDQLTDIWGKLYARQDSIFKLDNKTVNIFELIKDMNKYVKELIYVNPDTSLEPAVKMNKLISTRSATVKKDDSRTAYNEADLDIIFNSIKGVESTGNIKIDSLIKYWDRCKSIELMKIDNQYAGNYTGLYDAGGHFMGGFLDLPDKEIDCLSVNLRNHAIMVNLLGYFNDYVHQSKDNPDNGRNCNTSLVESSWDILRQLPNNYVHKAARHFWERHEMCKKYGKRGFKKGKDEAASALDNWTPEDWAHEQADAVELGIKIGVRKAAKNMLAKNMSLDLIAEVTGLSLEEIKALQPDGRRN